MSNQTETDRLRTIEVLGWLKRTITEGIRAGGWQPAPVEARMEAVAERHGINLAASVAARRANMGALAWELVTN